MVQMKTILSDPIVVTALQSSHGGGYTSLWGHIERRHCRKSTGQTTRDAIDSMQERHYALPIDGNLHIKLTLTIITQRSTLTYAQRKNSRRDKISGSTGSVISTHASPTLCREVINGSQLYLAPPPIDPTFTNVTHTDACIYKFISHKENNIIQSLQTNWKP